MGTGRARAASIASRIDTLCSCAMFVRSCQRSPSRTVAVEEEEEAEGEEAEEEEKDEDDEVVVAAAEEGN